MRTLYKTLATVGMIALSTAAALGVRHLTTVSRKRKETKNNSNSIEINSNDSQNESIEPEENSNPTSECESDDSEDSPIITSETEIKSDPYLDALKSADLDEKQSAKDSCNDVITE